MAEILGPKKVERYNAGFELRVVKLSQIEGVKVQNGADALDIHPFILSRWRRQAREGQLQGRVGVVRAARAQRGVRRRSPLVQGSGGPCTTRGRLCRARSTVSVGDRAHRA